MATSTDVVTRTRTFEPGMDDLKLLRDSDSEPVRVRVYRTRSTNNSYNTITLVLRFKGGKETVLDLGELFASNYEHAARVISELLQYAADEPCVIETTGLNT